VSHKEIQSHGKNTPMARHQKAKQNIRTTGKVETLDPASNQFYDSQGVQRGSEKNTKGSH
jgi:hypothetical protein